MDINFPKSTNLGLPGQMKPYRNPLIEITLLVIVSVLLGWFLILPKRAEIAAARVQLASVESEESQTAGKLANLQKLVQTLESSQAQIKDLDQALPLDGNILKLRFLIESLAQSVGVAIGDVSIAGKGEIITSGNKALLADYFGPNRSLQKLSGSVYVVGSFDQLKAFLQKLETSGRLIDITDLTIDSGTPGSLNLRLTINSYYMAP